MTTAMLPPDVSAPDAAAIEKVLIGGDLSKLTEAQRLAYYHRTCQSLGLNPLTQPFAYIPLNGKLKLYALKDATDQLRKIHGVSVQKVDKQLDADLYIVTAYVGDRTGRTDASTGAVTIGHLRGEARANAIMKAETKAKRRATLSICGLGMLDETEAEPLLPPGAAVMTVVDDGQMAPNTDATIVPAIEPPAPAVDAPAKPEGYDAWWRKMVATADTGIANLSKAFFDSPVPIKVYMNTHERDKWTELKAKAELVVPRG